MIKAHASYFFCCNVSEHANQISCCRIPDFDTFWMASDKCIKYWVIQHRQTALVVSKMLVCWLVIIVENESTASSNNSFWWPSDSKCVYFIQRCVESLHCCERSHVPNPEHARNICRNDLMTVWQPFHTDQRMIVTFEKENPHFNIRIPNVDVMVKSSGKQ